MAEDIYFRVTQRFLSHTVSTGRSRLLLCPTACDGLSSLLQMRISIATLLRNPRCMYRVWKGPLDPVPTSSRRSTIAELELRLQ